MDTLGLQFYDSDGQPKAMVAVEIADTPETRRQGLSKRAELPEGHGMFFDRAGAYWMKDVNFPLDIVFLDKQGTVLEKQHMAMTEEPDPCKPLYVPGSKEAAHALELPVGWFDKQGLKVGDRLGVPIEKKAQEEQPSMAPALIGGVAGAAGPAASLGQYLNLHYPMILQRLNEAKAYKGNKAGLRSFYRGLKPGDIMMEGGIHEGALGWLGDWAYGTPTGHAAIRGPGRGLSATIIHPGTAKSQLREINRPEALGEWLKQRMQQPLVGGKLDTEKLFRTLQRAAAQGKLTRQAVKQISARAGLPPQVAQALQREMGSLRPLSVQQLHGNQMTLRENMLTNFQELAEARRPVSLKNAPLHEWLIDKIRRTFVKLPGPKQDPASALTRVAFTPRKALFPQEVERVNKYMASEFAVPYDRNKALLHSIKQLAVPEFGVTSTRFCDPSGHVCYTLPIEAMRRVRRGFGESSQGLKGIYNNPNLQAARVFNKPRALEMLAKAKNARIALGLGAMGLLGGAGATAGHYLGKLFGNGES